MTLRELIRLTGIAERQVRYLIAEGFVPPPRGGRAYADYGDDHVTAIRRYMALRRTGLPPSAIRLVLEDGHAVPFPVMPGVTLSLDPALIGAGQDVDALSDRIRAVLVTLFQETTDDPTRADPDPP